MTPNASAPRTFSSLPRRLAVRLLASTVLVSVVLVAACWAGVMHLNSLHLNVANDLSENVESTLVAGRLESATEKLVSLLQDGNPFSPAGVQQVREQNQAAAQLLAEAQGLANRESEQQLVARVERGFQEYLRRWDVLSRKNDSVTDAEASRALARQLETTVGPSCRELREYNTDQIRLSDSDNRRIVSTLKWGLLAVGLGGPIGGLVLGYLVARGIRHSISQLSVRIRDAAGRLNRELGSVTLEEEGDLPGLHRQMQAVGEEIERVVGQLQQREREILRAEQLAAVGQVAAGVAHELRNPLTSVKMLVQTGLEGKPAPGLPPEDLAVIESEIRRMEQCIRQFLDFARPPVAERRRCSLVDVVRRAIALADGRARRQKVALQADFPPDPMDLQIDPEQIHQVVLNFLLNALDALPRGGTVTVQVKRAGGSERLGILRVPFVEVRVKDTGPGIAPRVRERLFEPFISSKETGLGLGLSICKRLVEAHGGEIRGDNDRDGGAVFSFTLPLSSPEPSGRAVPAAEVALTGGRKDR